ncbi:MAG: hypothetical protein ACOCYT_04480 [Chloroflexota bacterium]
MQTKPRASSIARDLDDGESGLPEINHLFVRHTSNTTLAKHTVYNRGHTSQQTCDTVLLLLQA